MRVRNNPFGGGQGQGPASGRPAAPLPSGQDDFFDNWDSQGGSQPAHPSQASNRVVPPHMRVAPPSHPQNGPMPSQPMQPMQQMQQQQPMQPMQQQQPMQAMQQQQPMQPMQQQQPMQPSMTAGQLPNSNAFVGAGAAAMGQMGFNEALAGAALGQAMSQMQMSGAMRWFPFLFMSLQQLFNVGHSYVLRKLVLLMCPFLKMQQGQGSSWADNSPGDISACQRGVGPDGLKVDVDQPDLYIPVMSYVTYVLIYGLQRGILHDFRPEVLPSTASFAMVLLFLEVGLAKMGFYVVGSAVPFLEIMANCSYKYVQVTLMVIARITTGPNMIYWLFFAYFSTCAAWAVRRFLLHFEPSGMKEQYGVAPSAMHGHIILGLAVAQLPLCWLLTPSAVASAAAAAR